MPFIDTNIFVAALNKQDKLHEKGRTLLTKAFMTFPWLHTSDYILNECLTVAWARTHNTNLIQQLDNFIQGSEKIEESTFATAKSYMRKHSGISQNLTILRQSKPLTFQFTLKPTITLKQSLTHGN